MGGSSPAARPAAGPPTIPERGAQKQQSVIFLRRSPDVPRANGRPAPESSADELKIEGPSARALASRRQELVWSAAAPLTGRPETPDRLSQCIDGHGQPPSHNESMYFMLDQVIVEYLTKNAGVDAAKFENPGLMVADLGLDSLGLVEMLFEVEDRFGFQIPDPSCHTME